MFIIFQEFLQSFVEDAVRNCPRSVFVFDEMELIPSGLLDILTSYVDRHHAIDGVS